MNKKEYKEYQKNVEDFFKREGITNLTGGIVECESCGFDFTQNGLPDDVKCGCGNTREMLEEPFFSNQYCDCCGTYLAGDRYKATGYNPQLKEVFTYEICGDCLYYAEYGQLDDMTMMDMEEEMVTCKFCGDDCIAKDAHLHDGEWVGDECCWDERLATTE